MSGWTLVLALWTGFSLVWWSASLLLARVPPPHPPQVPPDRRRLSIFKPVAAPRSARELERLCRCIGSFAAQLDEDSELLIGVTDQDWPCVAGLVTNLRDRHPAAEIKLVVASLADQYPNRKVALNKAIARHASGALWLWSDADIEAPPGTLSSLRRDLAAGGVAFVTSPYAVVDTERSPETLDKLFANVEFYPGAALLGQMGQIRFGFGSGMLFEAGRFDRRVDWDYLGGSLADDYHLGRLLGVGRLGSTRLSTISGASHWRGAILHYLRWHKTIRWCRPGSYAAQLLVLPVVGWLAAAFTNPTAVLAWAGVAGVVTLDAAAAYAICHALGSPLRARHLPAVAAWSMLRACVWVLCWLPWPIVWRGRRWWAPQPTTILQRGELHAGRPPGA